MNEALQTGETTWPRDFDWGRESLHAGKASKPLVGELKELTKLMKGESEAETATKGVDAVKAFAVIGKRKGAAAETARKKAAETFAGTPAGRRCSKPSDRASRADCRSPALAGDDIGPRRPGPARDGAQGTRAAQAALAKTGREAETRELLAILEELGVPKRAFARLTKSCEETLADNEPKKGPAAAHREGAPPEREGRRQEADGVRGRRAQATGQGAAAPGRPPRRGARGARTRERPTARWLTPEQAAFAQRATRIDRDVAAARALDVEIQELESPLPFVQTRCEGKGIAVRAAGITLHGVGLPEAKLRDVLTGLVRGIALARRLETPPTDDALAAVPVKGRFQAVLMSSHEDYRDAIKASVEAGELTRGNASIARQTSRYSDGRGFHVVDAAKPRFLCSSLLVEVWHQDAHRRFGEFPQPGAGRRPSETASRSICRAADPRFSCSATRRRRDERSRTGAPERNCSRRPGAACPARGDYLATSRSRGRIRPSRGPSPSVSAASTAKGCSSAPSWQAYLHERGDFGELLTKTVKTDRRPAAFEEPLGGPLAKFETAWKAWLLARPSDLASPARALNTDRTGSSGQPDRLPAPPLGTSVLEVGVDVRRADRADGVSVLETAGLRAERAVVLDPPLDDLTRVEEREQRAHSIGERPQFDGIGSGQARDPVDQPRDR